MSTSRHLAIAGALLGALFFSAVSPAGHAAPPTGAAAPPAAAKSHTPQQQRMADCSHQAKADGKKGDERRAFMSSCLKGKKAGATTATTAPKPKPKAASGQPTGTQG